MATLYAVLGVNTTATQDEIRKSYHVLSRKYHPDRNPEPSSEEKFKQILAAYDVLKDIDTRKIYDAETGISSGRNDSSSTSANPSNPGPASRPEYRASSNRGGYTYSFYFQSSGGASGYTSSAYSKSSHEDEELKNARWRYQQRAAQKEAERAQQAATEEFLRREMDEASEQMRKAREYQKRREEDQRKEAQRREKKEAMDRELVSLQLENDILLRTLGFMDANDHVDEEVMRRFKAYATQGLDDLNQQRLLFKELSKIRDDRLRSARDSLASSNRYQAATPPKSARHFAKRPVVVDLTNEDENEEDTDDPPRAQSPQPEPSRPGSKRHMDEKPGDGSPQKRARPDAKGKTFSLLDDLEAELPDLPPQQYNPKGDAWYKQGAPSSRNVPGVSSTTKNEPDNPPHGRISPQELQKQYLEVLRFGKSTAMDFVNRFTELEKNVPSAPELEMPQPVVSFNKIMEQLRTPMRELSDWFEQMMQMNKALEQYGKPL